MLAVALSKDDPKGEQRRRVQDRARRWPQKHAQPSGVDAPDYDGSPRQQDSSKPETKKIVVDPESIIPYWYMFLGGEPTSSDNIILDLDATDASYTAIRKAASTTVITTTTAICRCTCFAESTCCVHA